MSDKPDAPKPQRQQLQIQIDDATARGAYTNLCVVKHTHSEFVLDFVLAVPLETRAKVQSRVIMSPQHAKRLLAALGENLARYEERFGPIQVGNDDRVH